MGSGVVTAPTEANLRAALAGGGMVTFAIDGTISLTNTLVVTNATTLDSLGHAVTLSGGGSVQVLVVLGNASLVLKGLTIADGYLYNSDGAGLVNWGDATIVDCTFSNNVTQAPTLSFAGGGGAISHHGSALRVNGSTFVQNVSTYFGGALDCGRWNTLGANGQVGITNCTFYANSAGAVSLGGRLNQPVVLVNCTFAWNTNGGISFFTMLPSIVPKVINSVFAYTMNGGNAVAVADGGHNISSDNSTVFTVTTSRTNADPLLGPFANWGGPSWTVPLLPSSPARYYIDDNSAPATDQRGWPAPRQKTPLRAPSRGRSIRTIAIAFVFYRLITG